MARVTNRRVTRIIDSLEGNPQFDIAGLRSAAARFPYGAFGGPRPERKVEQGAIAEGPIEHGIILRLLVPYGDTAIPPGKVRDFHIVSCNYETPTQRRPGFTPGDW